MGDLWSEPSGEKDLVSFFGTEAQLDSAAEDVLTASGLFYQSLFPPKDRLAAHPEGSSEFRVAHSCSGGIIAKKLGETAHFLPSPLV